MTKILLHDVVSYYMLQNFDILTKILLLIEKNEL
jgi:hypothetical protein